MATQSPTVGNSAALAASWRSLPAATASSSRSPSCTRRNRPCSSTTRAGRRSGPASGANAAAHSGPHPSEARPRIRRILLTAGHLGGEAVSIRRSRARTRNRRVATVARGMPRIPAISSSDSPWNCCSSNGRRRGAGQRASACFTSSLERASQTTSPSWSGARTSGAGSWSSCWTQATRRRARRLSSITWWCMTVRSQAFRLVFRHSRPRNSSAFTIASCTRSSASAQLLVRRTARWRSLGLRTRIWAATSTAGSA